MKAEFDIHYQASNATARGTRRFREAVSIEIEEVPEEYAPVSLDWEFGRTRFLGGHHYRTIGELPQGELHGETPIARFLRQQGASGYGHISHYVTTSSTLKDRIYVEKRHPDIMESWGRLVAVEKVEALSRECIIVGREVLVRCGEPHFRVTLPFKDQPLSVSIETEDYSSDAVKHGPYSKTATTEVAALTCAISTPERVAEVAAHFGHEATLPEFTLLMQEAFTKDDAKSCLEAAADGLCRNISYEDRTWDSRKSIFGLYEELRGAYDEEDRLDHDTAAAVIERIREVLPEKDRRRKELDLVLDRWNNRDFVLETVSVPSPSR